MPDSKSGRELEKGSGYPKQTLLAWHARQALALSIYLSLSLSLSVCIDSIGKRHPGIPQSVGHIMTFYCVVRRKSAYYACATAFGVDVSGAAFNCRVPGGGGGHGILGTGGGGLLKLQLCLCLCLCVLAIVLQINIIL